MRPPKFDPSWDSEVQELYRNDLREMWDPDLEPQTWSLYHNQLEVYDEVAAKYGAETALDVGCAQATLALQLAERGLRVTALDIRKSFLDYARTRYEQGQITFVVGNIMEEPDIGTFDIVFANQIIEHLVHPVELLQTLAKYLTPEGVMVVTTPNQRYLPIDLPSWDDLGDPEALQDREHSATGGDHFYHYRSDQLRRVATEAGLRVLEVRHFESPWINGHMKFRYVLPWLPHRLRKLLDRITLAVAAPFFAHQLLLVAARPATERLAVDGGADLPSG